MSKYDSPVDSKKFSNYLTNAKVEWEIGYPAVLKKIKNGSRVLDFGCGNGEFAQKLTKISSEVVGVDSSDEMLVLARAKHLPNAMFVSSKNISNNRISYFDYITANFVFCTMTDEDLSNSLLEINKVLKQNGKLLILHSNWDKSNGTEFESFKLNFKENLRNGDQVTVTLKSEQPLEVVDIFRSIRAYESLLARHGFILNDVEEPGANEINSLTTRPAFYILTASKQ